MNTKNLKHTILKLNDTEITFIILGIIVATFLLGVSSGYIRGRGESESRCFNAFILSAKVGHYCPENVSEFRGITDDLEAATTGNELNYYNCAYYMRNYSNKDIEGQIDLT